MSHGPLAGRNGAVEHEEDCDHQRTDGEIDQGVDGPGGCRGRENRTNDERDYDCQHS